MPRQCCKTHTVFLSESHIQGNLLGQCKTCGAVRHGHRSNWKLNRSPDDPQGEILMQYREGKPVRKRQTKKEVSGTNKPRGANRIMVDEDELIGMSLKEGIAKLKALGILK